MARSQHVEAPDAGLAPHRVPEADAVIATTEPAFDVTPQQPGSYVIELYQNGEWRKWSVP